MSEVGGQIVRYLKVSQYRQRLGIRDLDWCIPKSRARATLSCDKNPHRHFLVIQHLRFDGRRFRDLFDIRTRRRRESGRQSRGLHALLEAEQFRLRSFFWSCAASSWSWYELVFCFS
jgi:hypothetical protein